MAIVFHNHFFMDKQVFRMKLLWTIFILTNWISVFGQPIGEKSFNSEFRLYENGQIVDLSKSKHYLITPLHCVNEIEYNSTDSTFVIHGTRVFYTCIVPSVKISKAGQVMTVNQIDFLDSLNFGAGDYTCCFQNEIIETTIMEKLYNDTSEQIINWSNDTFVLEPISKIVHSSLI